MNKFKKPVLPKTHGKIDENCLIPSMFPCSPFAPAIKDCLGNALSLAGILVTRGAVTELGSLGTTKLQVAKPSSANKKVRNVVRRAMAVIGMSEETKRFFKEANICRTFGKKIGKENLTLQK